MDKVPEIGDRIWFKGCIRADRKIVPQFAVFNGLRMSGDYSVTLGVEGGSGSFCPSLFEPMS